MTTRNLINIPGHPDLLDVTRKVDIIECHNKYKTNSVIMSLEVKHYINNIEVNYFPKTVYLTADNEVPVVSATGEDAPVGTKKDENGNYPAGIVGEYDFLYSLVKNNVANQLSLEEQYVIKRIDKINTKLYNK